MNYFLGLDHGGTTTKAALYDSVGTEIGVVSTETEVFTPAPGICERDMEAMWDANCRVIQRLLEKVKVPAKQIAGIAVCGHGKGLYLWGKDHRPVRNGILSTDHRAWELVQQWQHSGVQKNVFSRTYQQILPCQAVSLLAWLKVHEPEKIANIRWIFECKDYIRFRLTGKAMAERTDYSGANLMNLTTKQYDRELMALFGLEELFEALPPLCNSDDLCGTVSKEAAERTGLLEGTPVAGGMFDVDACALAVNALAEDRLCMIAGTWSINEYITKQPVLDGTVMLNSVFCDPNYYLVEESSPTSAGNLEWVIQQLFGEERKWSGNQSYQQIDQMVQQTSLEECCPIFTPFLMGSNLHPNAQASFVGLNSFHQKRHLFRSVYEGIVFSHKTHFDRLMQTRSKPFEVIRLSGGAAKSAVWAQMFADVMGIPVETVEIGETGTLGCAISAAVAVGEYANYREAAEGMVRVGKRFEPHFIRQKEYLQKYQRYCNVNAALHPVWHQMQQVEGGEGE